MLPETIMIQPRTSLTGAFIRMLPLGLLYASSNVVKEGLPVYLLDTRVQTSWEREIDRLINENTVVIGISVMSGVSILESIKISRYVKSHHPKIAVVWGGPHPTFSPDDVLKEPSIDYIIRGYASESFFQLVMNITGGKGAVPLGEIKGLSWRDGKEVRHNQGQESFEFIDFRDIPYGLIRDFSAYRHIDTNETVFSMYSVMGCPYRCAFCSSPAHYAKMKKKWQPYSVEEIVGHIQFVKERYGATFIYFIDDDSFVDLEHVEGVIDEIRKRSIRVKLGFRGARINEITKMSDGFIEKLVDAGTNTMHIGVESGSDRILKLMNKNITTEQILEANRKLACHPKIKVFYNFIVGYPTETIEETKMTRDLILRLIADNPSCCIIPLNKPRPLPGTDLFELASKHGYIAPKTLEEWGKYDVESSDYNPEWLVKDHNRFIRMMFLCMYFIDDKIFKFETEKNLRFVVLKSLAMIYKPFAMFRFRRGFYRLLVEDALYKVIGRLM